MKHKNGGELGLVMVTKWASEVAAQQFSVLYNGSVPKRYAMKPSAPGGSGGNLGYASQGGVSGSVSETPDGRVVVERNGDTVIAIESVPKELIEKVRQAVFGK